MAGPQKRRAVAKQESESSENDSEENSYTAQEVRLCCFLVCFLFNRVCN